MQNSIGLTWTFSKNRKMSLLCFLIGLLSFAHCSFAQSDYPNKPIKLVIPFPAGGSSDGIGRQVADKLSGVLKQTSSLKTRVVQAALLVPMQWLSLRPMATPWCW